MLKPRSSKDETFNLVSPMETKRFTRAAIFKICHKYFKNIMYVLARSTSVAVTRACSLTSAAENPMLQVEGLLTITYRKADHFMLISNTEYSRYENFDLTRMFNKQCFCDSNIPNSHG